MLIVNVRAWGYWCIVMAVMTAGKAASCLADEVGIGRPAPPIRIAEWVKGAPVDLAAVKGKHVVVVEFWATWCAPCRTSIPHLTEIQKKYRDKGVIIVSVSNEPAAKVRSFVQQQGEKMDYTVAADTPENLTTTAYMEGFYQRGIPYLFIVDKEGNVAWHGSPLDRKFEQTLNEILAGTYDLAAFKKVDEARRAEQRGIQLMDQYFGMIVMQRKPARELAPVGEDILKTLASNADMLNLFAWTILDDPRVRDRDLSLALRAAEAAQKATEGKVAYVLDTYARALFDNGRIKEAIEQQKKALEICADPKARPGYQQRLEKYQKAVSDA